MAEQYNCPNCGAPIGYSDKCAYCGTVLRWTPMSYVEFVPLSLNVRPAEVAVKIPIGYEDDIPKGKIIKHLAEELTDFIIDQRAFKLIVNDDIRDYTHVIKMRTYIGMERGEE